MSRASLAGWIALTAVVVCLACYLGRKPSPAIPPPPTVEPAEVAMPVAEWSPPLSVAWQDDEEEPVRLPLPRAAASDSTRNSPGLASPPFGMPPRRAAGP